MTKSKNTRYYIVGGIRFQVNFLSPFFDFDNKCGSHLFQDNTNTSQHQWSINFHSNKNLDSQNWVEVFKGSEQFEEDLPHKWSVIKSNNLEGIYIEFEDKEIFHESIAFIDITKQTIEVQIAHNIKTCHSLDPFFHPLGVLLLQYIAHYNNGFLIHASTVSFKNKGYLFSAVSGTGKSTMANLWQKKGATIINDDRLIILPGDDGYYAHNTPMPYYQDKPKAVKLHQLFLINQSPNNYFKKLPVLKGALGLLTNCMQFQYSEKQVQNRLNTIIDLTEACDVYECGFKPDTDIIELILNEFDQ
jgi:hypothetical protein